MKFYTFHAKFSSLDVSTGEHEEFIALLSSTCSLTSEEVLSMLAEGFLEAYLEKLLQGKSNAEVSVEGISRQSKGTTN